MKKRSSSRNIRQHLKGLFDKVSKEVAGSAADLAGVNVTLAAEHVDGDYQSNCAMVMSKAVSKKPRDVAEEVCAALTQQGDAYVKNVEVSGPGFINVKLDYARLMEDANGMLAGDGSLLQGVAKPETVVVDYSSPNLAKEMHVGHLRGTIIGDCLVRVLERLGHKVIRQNHVGDWGTQFGMLIAYLQESGQGGDSASQLADLEVFYQEAKQRFDDDPEFAEQARQAVVKLQSGEPESLQTWQMFIEESMSHCEAVYARLKVTLKREDMEPESYYNPQLPKIIAQLEKAGLLQVSDGAQCVFMDEFKGKDGSPLPLIVQKSGGGYLYSTTDLASVQRRSHEFKADRSLYVVDIRQSLHFRQVFAAARLAGFASDAITLEHVTYGTIMGKDGKPFKTRSGGTVKLAELLDEAVQRAYDLVRKKNPALSEKEHRQIAEVVGIAAVKYADLSKNRSSDYVFDWDAMLAFDGNTAPYLLYAYARICSVLRKSPANTTAATPAIITTVAEPTEQALLLKNLQFTETVHQVAHDCYPNQLCNYLYDLASCFMRFYESCPILKADDSTRNSRLALATLTAATLKEALDMLGIEVLGKM